MDGMPCPIFLNLQMYAQLLQSGEFAFFLETMEEMMWGSVNTTKSFRISFVIRFSAVRKSLGSEAYKSKCMPALDYSYLILDEDLDRLHTMDEIEIYNKRLKAFFAGMFGLQTINLHKPTKEEHLEEIVFDCTLKNKHLKYTYREFLGQMLKGILSSMDCSGASRLLTHKGEPPEIDHPPSPADGSVHLSG